MASEIRIFKRKLTNLSGANPLLWMGRLKAGIHLDVKELEEIEGKSARTYLEAILSDAKKVTLGALHDPRNGSENKVSQKLARLKKSRRLILQERGVDDLYLAWPFVVGQWPDGTAFRTPFLFLPVDLLEESGHWKLKPDVRRVLVNPAFLLAYARHTGKPLESSLFEVELDPEAKDLTGFLTELYNRIKETTLSLNFNSDLFAEPVIRFDNLRKSELPPGFQPGVMKLQPHAVLGLFTLSDSLLMPDFEFLEKEGISLESIFFKESPSEAGLPVERHFFLPFAVDGSQEECLRAVKQGKSLVVQGPPGTGKSQLISNLIADSVASGKSVLLVCQKRVALEVVYRRLQSIGIHEHVGLWADFKKDLTALFEQIARHIDNLEDTENRNKGLDTVLLERRFQQISQESEQLLKRLEEWKSALLDESVAGMHWVDLQRLPVQEPGFLLPFQDRFSSFLRPDWIRFCQWLERHWEPIRQSREPGTWLFHRSNWLESGSEAFAQLGSQIVEVSNALIKAREFWTRRGYNLKADSFPDALIHLAESSASVKFPDGVDWENWQAAWKQKEPELLFSDGFLEETEGEIKALLEGLDRLADWPAELEATREVVDEIHRLQFRFVSGPHGFVLQMFGWIHRPARQYRHFLRRFQQEGVDSIQLATVLKTAGGFLDRILENDLFQGFSFHPSSQKDTRNRLLFLLSTFDVLRTLRVFYKQNQSLLAQDHPKTLKELAGQILEMAQWYPDWIRWQNRLRGWFPSVDGVREISSRPEGLPAWFAAHQESIRKGDSYLKSVSTAEAELVLEILSHPKTNRLHPDDLLSVLESGWVKFWKDRLLAVHPALDYPGDWFQKDIRSLQNGLSEKETLSVDIVRLRLEENTHKDILKNRLQNRVTYRGLYHQVTRKRKRLPLRTLWESFGGEILKLLPCWLATPESVSATWPMTPCFDLVVFDEASQCFAEKGIPAAFRGRQLVVIGDDKQLPPNQLFASRWEEDAEPDDFYSEHDSFLDLAKQFLPQRMLRGHYRSFYPELVAFSNQHFYQGKLEMLPSPEALVPRHSQLYFTHVNGIWENQQNEIEAGFIAREALEFMETHPDETLGVITFNLRQQMLIEETVDFLAANLGKPVPESFFVKNIENVQGDERDHIWFSIAYARNESGKIISQFGSLSQDGGENRLNVAITRARKSVHVVSSLLPVEFPVAESAGKGPRLLKDYLEFVFRHRHGNRLNENGELVLKGSIPSFFDEAEEGKESIRTLRITNPYRMADLTGVKEFFGLRPLYLSRKGFRVEFDFNFKG